MLNPIINSVSPSNVGDFASCPLKLVLEADYPRQQDDRWIAYSSFGQLCHYKAQVAIGGTVDPVSDKVIRDAMQCPDVPHTPDNFWARVDKCTSIANNVVTSVTPLPPGVTWQAEKKSYPGTLLPGRVGRRGDVCGFGGSLDLWSSDGKIVWDYKFVGAKKIPKPSDINPRFSAGTMAQKVGDAGIKNTYLWQVSSYHILEGAEKTGIVWAGRDGLSKSYIVIDWTTPLAKELAARVRGFIEFTGHPMFRQLAWPVRGGHCDDCSHKDRCPAWCIDHAKEPQLLKAVGKLDDLDKLLMETGVVPQRADVGAIAPPPPPPPPPAPLSPPVAPRPSLAQLAAAPHLPPPPPPPILAPGAQNELF